MAGSETGMEEVRERALEYRLANQMFDGGIGVRRFKADEVEELMAGFAQPEREAEMELCCKDVCYGCRHGVPFAESGRNHASGTGAIYECKAWPIRERWAGKREGVGDDTQDWPHGIYPRRGGTVPSLTPRCPKCGNDGTGLGNALVVQTSSVKCWACATRFETKSLADFAQFFSAQKEAGQ
jgi:hypothetical protein